MNKNRILLFLLLVSSNSYSQKPYAALNHISIHVNDLKRSTVFYTRLFQLDSIPDPFPEYKVTWFKLGKNLELHLFEDKSLIPKGKYHFCFSVVSLDKFMRKLNNEKVIFFDGSGKTNNVTKRSDGVRQLYFYDPDGHKLEVNDAPF